MNLPPHMGAPGKAASFTGSSGMKNSGAKDPFGNMGTGGNGGVSHIPPEQRSGAMQMDYSVQEYTGNPRDSAGPVGNTGDANRVPNAGIKRTYAK